MLAELTQVVIDSEQILVRNARQILTIVNATFSSFETAGPRGTCDQASTRIDKLSCRWRDIAHGMAEDKKYTFTYGEWLAGKYKEPPLKGSPMEDDRKNRQHEIKQVKYRARQCMSANLRLVDD